MLHDISPENEQFVQYELETGNYRTRSELFDEALSLLKQRRDLERQIQAGIDSGPSIPAGEVFERLQAKAEQLARQASESVSSRNATSGTASPAAGG